MLALYCLVFCHWQAMQLHSNAFQSYRSMEFFKAAEQYKEAITDSGCG